MDIQMRQFGLNQIYTHIRLIVFGTQILKKVTFKRLELSEQ